MPTPSIEKGHSPMEVDNDSDGSRNGRLHASNASDASGQGKSARPMPKNFHRPLTCYYWWNGNCTKSDEECMYAHRDTGLVASAPIVVYKSKSQKRSEIVAGKAAQLELDSASDQGSPQEKKDIETREKEAAKWESDLHTREETLTAYEQSLITREKALEAKEHSLVMREKTLEPEEDREKATQKTAECLKTLIDALQRARTASSNVRRVLTRRRLEIWEQEKHEGEAYGGTVTALDGAIGAIAGFDLDLVIIDGMIATMAKKFHIR
ncbi:hypothetical protein H2203_001573 [Taxawa tesnikishii (nom. ined.)]|nr:hypothetical protein H2203_001573 [Dothideales sp. JES 119]